MQVLKITEKNIAVASEIVKNGGLVVYPTETVYGLGCDPFNIQAVKQVFQVKGNRKKQLPILASSIEHVEKVAYLSETAKCVAAKFWPGRWTSKFRYIFNFSRLYLCETKASMTSLNVCVLPL